MKDKDNFRPLIIAAALLFVGACLYFGTREHAGAQTASVVYPSGGLTVFSVGTTNGATALSWTIVPARSANSGTPLVTSLAARTDLAINATVYSYIITTNTTANYVSSSTSLPVAATNGFASGDVIIIRHMADENYEKRVLTTFTSSTNLTTTVAPMEALAIGDTVYRCTSTGTPAISYGIGNNNTNLVLQSSGGVIAGQKGMPLLLETSGTSKCWLDNATGVYQ